MEKFISNDPEELKPARMAYEKLKKYHDFPAIFNSKNMIEIISAKVEKGESFSENEKQVLNVGLLAAKALDFDDRFHEYASALHEIWHLVLGRPSMPPGGDRLKAYKFYQSQGFQHPNILNHLKGIDFNSPVDDSHNLKNGDIVFQWKIDFSRQGDYYSEKSSSPSCVGIHDAQGDNSGNVFKREKTLFKVLQNVIVLKSTAAPVLDTWSIKGKSFRTRGGCIQYFNSKNKNDIKQSKLVRIHQIFSN